MRTFIAIELTPEIKDFLAKVEQQLKSAQADVKWVAPENIHLTLKFLGEIDEKKLEDMVKIINGAAARHAGFKAKISSIGAFPSLNSPRVIWVGIDEGSDQIKSIAKDLETSIAGLGIPKEDRQFSSHITIGRTRSPANRDALVRELNKLSVQLGKEDLEFIVGRITLFKSTLTPKGPIYDALTQAHLKTT